MVKRLRLEIGMLSCLDPDLRYSSRLDNCPACGSSRLDAAGGAQMRLIEMEIEGHYGSGQRPA
jgi:hydrogenase nickel incorporation protein HypA/HybF